LAHPRPTGGGHSLRLAGSGREREEDSIGSHFLGAVEQTKIHLQTSSDVETRSGCGDGWPRRPKKGGFGLRIVKDRLKLVKASPRKKRVQLEENDEKKEERDLGIYHYEPIEAFWPTRKREKER